METQRGEGKRRNKWTNKVDGEKFYAKDLKKEGNRKKREIENDR